MNVLVVDDSGAMRKIIIAALAKTELRGSRTVEAVSGKDGLDKFLDGNFGMILSDWNMPEMSCSASAHIEEGLQPTAFSLQLRNRSRRPRRRGGGGRGR
jgi:CheY-like chemotaxis protein